MKYLNRRRDTADALGVSESQVRKWEKQGLLSPVRIPGIRAVRHRADEVARLGEALINGQLPESHR